jgi:signal transduction histidine kinase
VVDSAINSGMTRGSARRHYIRRVARRPTSRQLFDLGLAAGLTALGLAEVLVPFSSRQGDGSAAVACVAVAVRGLALTQRRARPLAAALVVYATLPVEGILGPSYVLFYGQALMIGVALYAVARHPPLRQAWLGIGTAAVLLVGADLTVPQLQGPNEIAFHWSVAGLVVAAALSLRRWAHTAQEHQRRAVAAEVAAAEKAMAAVVEERARIARELHDIVAHAISTIVVQAGAAEQVVEDDPARARASLETIRATGASALAEMRRLVSVLREEGRADDPADVLEPQPGLSALPALVEAMGAAGLAVDLAVTGDERPLPAGLDLAVYRIVQEGLTNVRRHSAARQARVCLAFGPEELTVEVHDCGPGAETRPDSGGHGLVGIRERVSLYGGSVTAGPDGHGGYRVSARLAASS